jgi:hypothetical protein
VKPIPKMMMIIIMGHECKWRTIWRVDIMYIYEDNIMKPTEHFEKWLGGRRMEI